MRQSTAGRTSGRYSSPPPPPKTPTIGWSNNNGLQPEEEAYISKTLIELLTQSPDVQSAKEKLSNSLALYFKKSVSVCAEAGDANYEQGNRHFYKNGDPQFAAVVDGYYYRLWIDDYSQ